jgi:4'-phosphopantetheinyl transferase
MEQAWNDEIPTHLALSPEDVHVWRVALDQPAIRVERLAVLLSTDESQRAARFYRARDRQRFIVGRGLLRVILGYYLDVPPGQIQFCYGIRGKPALSNTDGSSVLQFNVSHSHNLAVYAIARDRELGIDLEHLRLVNEADRIVRSFFTQSEQAIWATLPADQKQAAFFNAWTRKEAYLKAIGDGLALPTSQVEVTLAPDQPAQLLSVRGDAAEASHWSMRSFHPAPGYTAALVVAGQNWHLTCWQPPALL